MMTPFLAYLARRKYELQKQIDEENEYSLYLSKYKGALEELNGVILQLPAWEQAIVEELFSELEKMFAPKGDTENEIPVQA